MDDRKALKQIALSLTGISYGDLTAAEKRIADILIGMKLLKIGEYEEVQLP